MYHLLSVHKDFQAFAIVYLQRTIIVRMLDDIDASIVLFALQYIRFPLSSFTTMLLNDEIVLTRLPFVSVSEFDWGVMSSDDLCHEIVAAGLL